MSSTASLFRVLQNHYVVQPVDSCVHTHAPLRGPWFHRDCWLLIESRVLSLCHTPLPFGCADDSCLCLVLHVGVPTLLNSASSSFTWLRPPRSAFTFAAVFLLTSPRASWSAGTDRLRRVCTDRPVYTSGGDKLLSFMPSSLLAPFHHCTLLSLDVLCTWLQACGLTFRSFCFSPLSVLHLKYGLGVHLGLLRTSSDF